MGTVAFSQRFYGLTLKRPQGFNPLNLKWIEAINRLKRQAQ